MQTVNDPKNVVPGFLAVNIFLHVAIITKANHAHFKMMQFFVLLLLIISFL